MTNAMPKDQARRLIDQLPDTATWEDLIDEIRVREAIESGLRDSEAGALRSVEEQDRSDRCTGSNSYSKTAGLISQA
ncbi:hypothetical protein SAMN05216203_1040 [Marinobacter daqiaonensis]|uniref:Addiction module component n=1 Tax=Marinobacter daqiaonensis TaxID=650891 RepID=A0A1I6HAM5_9GAMM|nr:hypothetical protein SAMN05216203_1040 [Marinobacter daqiaonensis]